MKAQITIGTRGSKLALWQAQWVQTALQSRLESESVDLLIIKTKGDKILDVPLAKVGGKGLFVKEIEEALLDGRIDLAVHSMKDMPAELPEGLCIGAVPAREDPRDVLLTKTGCSFEQLPAGAAVGTSSLRRSSQLLHSRPDLTIRSLRGNLDTRIEKLEKGDLDAIVLAAAGVKRLGYENRISQYLDESIMLPAVGQGALCIETRRDDPDMAPLLSTLENFETRAVVTAERAFLHRLEGGCQVPIAAGGIIQGGSLTLDGLVADLDGRKMVRHSLSGPVEKASGIGIDLAEKLLEMGAGDILSALQSDSAEGTS